MNYDGKQYLLEQKVSSQNIGIAIRDQNNKYQHVILYKTN